MGVDHGGAHVFMAEELLDGTDVVTVLEQVGGKTVAKGVGGDALVKACFLNGLFNGTLEGGWVEVMAEEALTPGPFAKHPLWAPGGRGEALTPGRFAKHPLGAPGGRGEALTPGRFAKHPLGAPGGRGEALTPGPSPTGRGESGVAGELGGGEDILPGEFAGGVGVFGCQGVGEVDFAVACGEVFFVEEADAFDLTAQVRDDGLRQGDDAVFFTLPSRTVMVR